MDGECGVERGDATGLRVIRVGDDHWPALENLFCEQGEGALGPDFDEEARTAGVHRFHLCGPLDGIGHLRGEFCEYGFRHLAARRHAVRIPAPVEIRGDRDHRQTDFKALEEAAERFVGRGDDAAVECVAGLQLNAGHALGVEGRHDPLHRLGLTGDDRHLWTVLVGGDDVACLRVEHRLNLLEGCRDTGHDAAIGHVDAAHLGAARCDGAQRAIEVENPRDHQGCIFSQRMARNHVGLETVRLQQSV